MDLDFKRLLESATGKIMISIILGLGLATIFRKICKDGSCIDFHGPVIGDLEHKIYRHDEKCYQYTSVAAKCNPDVKRVVDVSEKDIETFVTGDAVVTD